MFIFFKYKLEYMPLAMVSKWNLLQKLYFLIFVNFQLCRNSGFGPCHLCNCPPPPYMNSFSMKLWWASGSCKQCTTVCICSRNGLVILRVTIGYRGLRQVITSERASNVRYSCDHYRVIKSERKEFWTYITCDYPSDRTNAVCLTCTFTCKCLLTITCPNLS